MRRIIESSYIELTKENNKRFLDKIIQRRQEFKNIKKSHTYSGIPLYVNKEKEVRPLGGYMYAWEFQEYDAYYYKMMINAFAENDIVLLFGWIDDTEFIDLLASIDEELKELILRVCEKHNKNMVVFEEYGGKLLTTMVSSKVSTKHIYGDLEHLHPETFDTEDDYAQDVQFNIPLAYVALDYAEDAETFTDLCDEAGAGFTIF